MTDTPRPPAFITVPPQRVVFVCHHNASRSAMAEGFARVFAPPEAQVWSAGDAPTQVHPMAVRVMAEVDIDISGHQAKHLDGVPWQEADTIVTLCGEDDDTCPPIGPLVRRVHWPLPDPTRASEDLLESSFREVRDMIRWRVASLWPPGDR